MNRRYVVSKYYELKSEIDRLKSTRNINPASHFMHLTGQALTPLQVSADPELEEERLSDKEFSDAIKIGIEDLEIYLNLIRQNDQYATDEMYGRLDRGHAGFSDMREMTKEEAVKMGFESQRSAYIHLSEKRLKAKVQ